MRPRQQWRWPRVAPRPCCSTLFPGQQRALTVSCCRQHGKETLKSSSVCWWVSDIKVMRHLVSVKLESSDIWWMSDVRVIRHLVNVRRQGHKTSGECQKSVIRHLVHLRHQSHKASGEWRQLLMSIRQKCWSSLLVNVTCQSHQSSIGVCQTLIVLFKLFPQDF